MDAKTELSFLIILVALTAYLRLRIEWIKGKAGGGGGGKIWILLLTIAEFLSLCLIVCLVLRICGPPSDIEWLKGFKCPDYMVSRGFLALTAYLVLLHLAQWGLDFYALVFSGSGDGTSTDFTRTGVLAKGLVEALRAASAEDDNNSTAIASAVGPPFELKSIRVRHGGTKGNTVTVEIEADF